MTLFSVIIVLLTPLWTTLVHAAIVRTRRGVKLPRQKLAFLCCLGTAVGVSFLAFVVELFVAGSVGPGDILFAGVTSTLLTHLYFHIFNMSETARRVRILLDIKKGKKPSGGAYTDQEMISIRLDRLYDLKQVRVWSGKYSTKPTLLRFASQCIQLHERLLFPQRR